jgi:hypothetical protein
MSEYNEEEMLAYEVEDDETEQAVMPIAPVPVRVCEPVVTVETVPQHMSAYTFVMSTSHADTAIRQILPQDPLRVRAVIIVHDQPVILCHSQVSAAAPANVVTNTPEPSGAYVFAGTNLPSRPIPIYGVQEVWAAATIAESARVTVLAYRRNPS